MHGVRKLVASGKLMNLNHINLESILWYIFFLLSFSSKSNQIWEIRSLWSVNNSYLMYFEIRWSVNPEKWRKKNEMLFCLFFGFFVWCRCGFTSFLPIANALYAFCFRQPMVSLFFFKYHRHCCGNPKRLFCMNTWTLMGTPDYTIIIPNDLMDFILTFWLFNYFIC